MIGPKWRFLGAFLALSLTGGVVALILVARHRPPTPAETPGPVATPSFPLPSRSSSPHLNTNPDVRHVGSATCASCHPSQAASFRRTGMGRSMAAVDLSREPPDGSFDHARSRRRYQVVRKDGAMIHRELLLGTSEEVVLSEFPVKYVVGSGRHSLTYLVEDEGFLVESPVTWYAARNAWGMSPGYDQPEHAGFERAIGEGCLVCHAGQARAVAGSLHRMRIDEAAIGCERCHGPGSLHVARHAPGQPEFKAGEPDYTIVKPSRLPRPLAEAVCQQCHLRSSATIVARGRKIDDFRPGLPLEDFRHDYSLDGPDRAMTVVGHVEQMRLSRCYQGSPNFSCLTCHNPHDEPTGSRRETYYKNVCVQCHAPERCKIDPAVRQKESPANNCVVCHMPTAPTEIPHLAFTHHRVGIHGKKNQSSGEATVPTLRPFNDLSRWGQADQNRSLGLGYLELANMTHTPLEARRYRGRALELLNQVRGEGLRDGAVDAALARLRFDLRQEGVSPLAESALASQHIDAQDRCHALFLLADARAAAGRRQEALAPLRELETLRRHSGQLLLLADCERAAGDGDYIATLERAVRINPRLWKVHNHLADHYRQKGDLRRAEYHSKRAVP